jgi:CRP-like cAMP-binding protein
MRNGASPTDHWLLEGLEPAQRSALLALGHDIGYSAGEVIFREGDPSDGLYLITVGTVRLATSAGGGDTMLALISANDVVGEMGIMDGAPRSATAVAHTMCAGYWLPTEPFLDVLVHTPALAIRLIIVLAQRLRTTNQRVAELAALLPPRSTEDTLPV